MILYMLIMKNNINYRKTKTNLLPPTTLPHEFDAHDRLYGHCICLKNINIHFYLSWEL
jgi:hypothetical protein